MRGPIGAKLIAAGMSEPEAQAKATLFEAAEKALASGAERRWFVPGRIEVLGKHTDYAGGRSLLCAMERGICVAATPRSDNTLRITDVTRRQAAEMTIAAHLESATGWENYARTLVRRLARNFAAPLRGADIAVASDLPSSAGMSSSSALMIAIFTALAEVNRLSARDECLANMHRPEDLAAYLACVENGQSFGMLAGDSGVGTFGGSEDHTAILCAAPGQLSQYRFCPATLERRVRLPAGYVFCVATSGIVAHKTGAARDLYNRASHAAATVLRAWNAASGRDDPTLFAAVTHAADAPERIRQALSHSADAEFSPAALRARFDQFFLESQAAVPGAAAALSMGAMEVFGKVVDCSQSAAERLLGNQVPETIELARSARDLGACAASAFGAGFGGSVWALVAASNSEPFRGAWRAHYQRRFPAAAAASEFFLTCAGPPLTSL